MSRQRSPFLVGGLMLLGLAIVLGLFVLTRPSTPRVEPVAATDTLVTAAATATPALAIATVGPTAVATEVPAELKTLRPVVTSIDQPLDLQVVGAPSPTAYGWWDMTNQFDVSLDAEVRAGFNRYWQQRVDAAFNLDESLLPQVEANPWLAAEVAALNNLRAAGTAHRVEANHTLRVRYATDSEALVLDDYSLRVETVHAQTKEPVSDAASGTATYHTVTRMQKLDGAWKAVDEVQVTRS